MVHYGIYSVHMPLFMFVSGYYSKKRGNLKHIAAGLLLPYVCFDLLYVASLAVRGQDIGIPLLVPSYVYWYILSLAVMRILTWLLGSKFKYAILPVLALSLLVAVWPPGECQWAFLGLGRTVLLFPIFAAGLYTRQEWIGWFRRHRWLCLALILLAVAAIFLMLGLGWVTASWATHDEPADAAAWGLKHVFMFLAAMLFFGLAGIMPNRACRISRWGKNSMLVYLLHPYAVTLLHGLMKLLDVTSQIALLCVGLAATVVITDVLSGTWLAGLYQKAMHGIAAALHLEGRNN